MGKDMKISVITAAHIADEGRAEKFRVCLESIAKQTYEKEDIEHIIIDDGSTYPFEYPDYPWLKVIHQENLQRITAYNNGFKEARGDVYAVLDSDDEYASTYLADIAHAFQTYPNYRMFNFGCTFISKDGGTQNRDPFRPKEESVGHEIFGGGQIVWGTFVWHRSVYDELGAFPPPIIKNIDCSEINYSKGPRELNCASPYDFSAAAQMEFPEIRQYFFVPQEEADWKIIKELGNPFGQDFYLAYKYTRKVHMKPIDKYEYLVHLR
jgi:glycosyltransferase involved in cell wall biosynthesis